MIFNRRRQMGGKALPYDYEVWYLESTGTQWIYQISGQITKVELRFQFTNNTKLQRIFCMGDSTIENESITIYENGSLNIATCINQDWSTSNSISWSKICSLTLNTQTKTTLVTTSEGTTSSWNNSTTPVYKNNFWLFAEARGNKAKAKLWYCKLYNGDTLMFDLIPVVKDGIGYMYDKISGQLLGNAGTGSFSFGPRREQSDYIWVRWDDLKSWMSTTYYNYSYYNTAKTYPIYAIAADNQNSSNLNYSYCFVATEPQTVYDNKANSDNYQRIGLNGYNLHKVKYYNGDGTTTSNVWEDISSSDGWVAGQTIDVLDRGSVTASVYYSSDASKCSPNDPLAGTIVYLSRILRDARLFSNYALLRKSDLPSRFQSIL